MHRLLQARADINVECKYRAFEMPGRERLILIHYMLIYMCIPLLSLLLRKEGRALPIHLAVQGCLENVQLLMDHGADINARVKLDGQSHFGPIHATQLHLAKKKL